MLVFKQLFTFLKALCPIDDTRQSKFESIKCKFLSYLSNLKVTSENFKVTSKKFQVTIKLQA